MKNKKPYKIKEITIMKAEKILSNGERASAMIIPGPDGERIFQIISQEAK